MGLDARAVELVLETRGSELRQPLADVFGGLREHRLERPKQPDGHAGEPLPPFGERRSCHSAEIAGHHQRPADLPDGKPCSLCDRLDHQSFERALAQFAEHGKHQEVLLVLCGAGQ